jgi:hypothetical protein
MDIRHGTANLPRPGDVYKARGLVPSGGLFGIVDYRDFGNHGLFDSIDNLLKAEGNLAAIGSFAALSADLRGNVFNDDDAIPEIGGKRRTAVPQFAFAHKTGHVLSSCLTLKSSDHSAGFGKYADMSHNSAPFEPQTTCRGLPARVFPKTRQLG